jgi:SAM-dependent methyltransferase
MAPSSATLNPPKSPEVINQSTPQYWDGMVADFDSIYTGESKSTLDVLLDRWLRKDIYDRVVATVEGVSALGTNQLVLDVGVGTGRLCIPLGKAGHRIVGVDFSPQMLEKAQANTTQAGVVGQCQFFQADLLTSMPETVKQQGSYAAAAILGVLDYIEDPSPMFANLKNLGLKRVYASFPRAGTLRCELRKLRYKVQGLDCPLYFFTPEQVDQYGYQVMGAQKVTQQLMGELHFAVYEF